MDNLDQSSILAREKSLNINNDPSLLLAPMSMSKAKSSPAKKKSSMRSKKGIQEEEKKDDGPIHSKDLLNRALRKIQLKSQQSKYL